MLKGLFKVSTIFLGCLLLAMCNPAGDDGKTNPLHNMFAEYLLDGNATDSSGKWHALPSDGTLTGATWEDIAIADRFNQAGKAISFDGIDDFIQLCSPENLVQCGNCGFAISFWIKLDATTAENSRIISSFETADPADEQYSYDLYINSEYSIAVGNKLQGDPVALLESSIDLKDGKWHHIVYLNTGFEFPWHYLYLDNQLVASGSATLTDIDASSDIRFGAYFSNNNEANFFKGCLDNVRFFGETPEGGLLTENEIDALFHEPEDGF